MASLFVLPVKSWLQQRDDLARKQNELAVLNNANAQLAGDVTHLQTPDGIKEAARQEIGLVSIGEQRITVLATPNAPLTLPTGWPYDGIAEIIAVRNTPVAPVAPVTPSHHGRRRDLAHDRRHAVAAPARLHSYSCQYV